MGIRQDVTYAARVLGRSPLFTLTAVLSLAIAIAANAAMFSLADALLFRRLPGIVEPGRLVDVSRSEDGAGFQHLSYPNYLDYRDRNSVFEDLAAYKLFPDATGLGLENGADRVYGTGVTSNYFSVLGVQMALGRPFRPDEDHPGAGHAVTVIGYDIWQRLFNSDAETIGRTIRLNGRPLPSLALHPWDSTATQSPRQISGCLLRCIRI